MSATLKNSKTIKGFSTPTVLDKMRSQANSAFAIKKAEEASEFLLKAGLPGDKK